jgi:hypothetical protein
MIEKFYTTTIAVTRMTWVGDSSSEISRASFSGHIQQARPEYAEHVGEAWGLVFLVWCDEATDVQEGDTLTIATGDYAGTYNVRNKMTNAIGNNKHLELVCIKDKS